LFNPAFVRIDMEGSTHTQATLDVFHELRETHQNVGIALQAYLLRTREDVRDAIARGDQVRLCKGAYKEPPEVAFPRKRDVDESFFMLIHYWDPHWPFKPPAQYQHLFYQGNPIDPNNHALDQWWLHPLGAVAKDTWMRRPEGLITDPDYISALYDQEIRHVDDGVGQILRALDEYGLADNTIVVVVGDHGESLVEHGIFFDHHGLYEVTLRVPFIARWPKHIQPGTRITQMLQHHDIAPTLIEAAGVGVPAEMDGLSFLGLLTGDSKVGGRDSAVSCECTWQAKWSLRTDRFKLILARGPDLYGSPDRELYDLVADPGEKRNIALEDAGVTAALEGELEGWIASKLAALGRSEDPLRKHGISLNFQ
jgi:arylsulfatase A-like enzyme